MDVKYEINKAMVNAQRNKQRLAKIILGKKEKRALEEQLKINEDVGMSGRSWSVLVDYVDEESYFETVNGDL